MSLITQYSRISHHTISPSGTTFTVPSQEDFTSTSSPWSTTDLALSEFGVNQTDNKLYVRIGTHINEVGLNMSGGTGGTLTGTPNQVVYFDQNGNPTSDSGFTHSITGGTIFYVSDNQDYLYGLYNGELFGDSGNTGTALLYQDGTSGRTYINGVMVGKNTDMGTVFENATVSIWQDQNSGNQSIIMVSEISGSPIIVLQAAVSLDSGNTQNGGFIDLFSTGSDFGYQSQTISGTTFTGIQVDGVGNLVSLIGNSAAQNFSSCTYKILDPTQNEVLYSDSNGNISYNTGFTYNKTTGNFLVSNGNSINGTYLDPNTTGSTIIGGGWLPNYGGFSAGNRIKNSNTSTILGGVIANRIYDSNNGQIIGGFANLIQSNDDLAVIIGGNQNQILSGSQGSLIFGGYCSSILGSTSNSIIAGDFATISGGSCYSSIIGGTGITISGSFRSAIIGGQNLLLSGQNDTVLVPNLIVNNSILSGGTDLNNIFVQQASGLTGSYPVGSNTLTLVNGLITAIA